MFESSVCLNFPLGKCTVMSKCHKIMNANVYTHTTEWKQKSNITELPAIYIKLQP